MDVTGGSLRSSHRPLGQALLVSHDQDQDPRLQPPSPENEQVSPRSNEALRHRSSHDNIENNNDDDDTDVDGYKRISGFAADVGGGDKDFVAGANRRSSSVMQILRELAVGETIGARGEQWKLTRAVVHLEDAWRGRVSSCPLSLDQDRIRRLFKVRWHLRRAEMLLIHGLLALSLVETPSWCVKDGRCFWNCFPDFSRNWHLDTTTASIFEVAMLTFLVSIAMLDMYLYRREYWATGSGKGVTHAQLFKHTTLALYSVMLMLGFTVSLSFHLVVGYCRVMLYLSAHRRTMLIVTQLRHILGAVLEIWLLIFVNILLFAWIGIVLFTGTEEGITVFPNLMEAAWRLFVLFTTTNFPDVMMSALTSVRASIIFFAAFVTLNVFFLAPLSLAFIFNVFRGGQKGIPRLEEAIRSESIAAAFALLDAEGTGRVKMSTIGALLLEVHSLRGVAPRELVRLQDLIEEAGLRTPEQPSLDLADFKDAVRVMDRSLQHAEWITEMQWYFPRLYQSSGFRAVTRIVKRRITLWPGIGDTPRWTVLVIELAEAFLLLVSFIALLVGTSDDVGWEDVRLAYIQLAVVSGFVVTTAITAVVRGWHNCVQRPAFVFNLTITFASTVVIVLALTPVGAVWGCRVMRALRVLQLGLVVAFLPRLGFLVRMLLIMTKRASTPASVLLAWAFFMAVLGVQLFGGLVCVPSLAVGPETCEGVPIDTAYAGSDLSLLNFNDVPTAFVTLFVLFVVNDWYLIVNEFVDVTGSGWARAFFIVNYIMGVAVILNLVVTVVINSFWDEYKTTVNPTSALRSLHDAAAQSAHPAAAAAADLSSGNGNLPAYVRAPHDAGGTGISTPATSFATDRSAAEGASDHDWAWGGDSFGDRIRGGSGARVMGEEAGVVVGAEGGVGGMGGGGGGVLGVTRGDQEGMDAERAITCRASQRRLTISGLT